jgi:Asp/Glu/hydantoin racemase
VEELKPLYEQILPGIEVVNIVDDSLVREILQMKTLTHAIQRRMLMYALELESLGCAAVLSNCSSLGEITEVIRRVLGIPFLKIDEPMAQQAVRIGKRVAIVATADTTIGPSTRLLQQAADDIGKEIEISCLLAEGAYNALLVEKNRAKHDEILMKTIDRACMESDVVCLAQGSMFTIAERCTDKPVPVLHTFRSGVGQLRQYVGLE